MYCNEENEMGGGGESVVFPIMFSVVYEANSSWGEIKWQ